MANPETPAEGGGALPILIAACLTALIGLGTGVSISVFMLPPSEHAVKTSKTDKSPPSRSAHDTNTHPAEQGNSELATTALEEGGEAEATEEAIDPAQLAFASFPPVIVNLKEQSGSWVRVEGGIQYISDGDIPGDAIGPLAAEMAMNYFRTLTIQDFEGGDGLQLIKMDLAQIAQSLSKGQIRGYTFTSFIIE
jgi:flagellar basal body-associated protein FliL